MILVGVFTVGCMWGGRADQKDCEDSACICQDIRTDWVGTCDLGEGMSDEVEIELRLGGALDAIEGVGVLTTAKGARFPGDLSSACQEPLDTSDPYGQVERVQALWWSVDIDGVAHEIDVQLFEDHRENRISGTCKISDSTAAASGSIEFRPL
jgi:hypothetical protein